MAGRYRLGSGLGTPPRGSDRVKSTGQMSVFALNGAVVTLYDVTCFLRTQFNWVRTTAGTKRVTLILSIIRPIKYDQ